MNKHYALLLFTLVTSLNAAIEQPVDQPNVTAPVVSPEAPVAIAPTPSTSIVSPETAIVPVETPAAPQTEPKATEQPVADDKAFQEKVEAYKKLTDEEQDTRLIAAVKAHNLNETKALLSAGANPDAEIKEISDQDPSCKSIKMLSLLAYALQAHDADIAQELFSYDADIDYEYTEVTYKQYFDMVEITAIRIPLLICAIEAGLLDIVNMFVKVRVDINQPRTIEKAVYSCDSCSNCTYLHEICDVCTPLSRAQEVGNKEIIEILKAAGAQ